jgi:hypothetical protein
MGRTYRVLLGRIGLGKFYRPCIGMAQPQRPKGAVVANHHLVLGFVRHALLCHLYPQQANLVEALFIARSIPFPTCEHL